MLTLTPVETSWWLRPSPMNGKGVTRWTSATFELGLDTRIHTSSPSWIAPVAIQHHAPMEK